MMDIKPSIALLILAAGAGRRMGRTKQLLPWKSTTLLGNAIANAKHTMCRDVYVVLGYNAENIRKAHRHEDVIFIDNVNWNTGMGSSISCGINYLLKQPTTYDGILIMLCDQPYIDTPYLNEMMVLFSEKNIMVTTDYGNRSGVPAIFGPVYYKELSTLHGEHGARDIIKTHSSCSISLNPRGKQKDVDTLADYSKRRL